MTAPIVLHNQSSSKAPTSPAEKEKHFEDVWTAAEQLFEKDKLKVDSILNELQAKVSLYRVLCVGEFDSTELASAQASMIGKMLMTLAQLSLKEDVNVFLALQGAIEERKLIAMESSLQNSQATWPKAMADLRAEADKVAPGAGERFGELLSMLKEAGQKAAT